jgi:hypothetical protein
MTVWGGVPDEKSYNYAAIFLPLRGVLNYEGLTYVRYTVGKLGSKHASFAEQATVPPTRKRAADLRVSEQSGSLARAAAR